MSVEDNLHPEERGLQRIPDSISLRGLALSGDQSSLAIPPSAAPMLEKVGFSPLLSRRLGALTEVLNRLMPSEKRTFNLRVTGGQIEAQTETVDPFNIQIAGTEDGKTVISVTRAPNVRLLEDCCVDINEVQRFTRTAFPDKLFFFYAKPVVKIYESEEKSSDLPKNVNLLQREEMGKPPAREIDSGIIRNDILPTIERDLYEVTSAGMMRLARQATVLTVDATFYEKWDSNPRRRRILAKGQTVLGVNSSLYPKFEVLIEEENKVFMEFKLGQGFLYTGECYFERLYYRGTASEVEGILEPLTEMFRQTHGYKWSLLEEQQALQAGKE